MTAVPDAGPVAWKRAQLGRTLSDAEVDDIVAFLATLTGVRPAIPTPELPVD